MTVVHDDPFAGTPSSTFANPVPFPSVDQADEAATVNTVIPVDSAVTDAGPGEPVDVDGVTQVPAGGPIAGGRRTPIPAATAFPAWGNTQNQDTGDEYDVDYTDLTTINRDLLHLRVRLNRVRRGLRDAGRDAVEAKARYHRQLRRALVQQSGGSAESRKAHAELTCEELEADMVMKQQIVDEFTTLLRTVRDDIENAKTAAYNVRALMNVL